MRPSQLAAQRPTVVVAGRKAMVAVSRVNAQIGFSTRAASVAEPNSPGPARHESRSKGSGDDGEPATPALACQVKPFSIHVFYNYFTYLSSINITFIFIFPCSSWPPS